MRVNKINKKQLIVGVVLLLLIATGVTAFILSRDTKPKNEEQLSAADGIIQGEKPQELVKFDEVIELYTQGKYGESLNASRLYAEDITKDSTSRLNMYLICIKSANNVKDTDVSSVCLNGANEIIQKLEDVTTKNGWQSLIDDAYNKLENTEPIKDESIDEIQR